MAKLIAQDGTEYRLTGPTTSIGREGCDVMLTRDDMVSRRHAEVRRRGEELVLIDLDSTNGTFVNGVRLRAPRTLQPGDVVQVGNTRMTLQIEGQAPPTRMMSEPPRPTPRVEPVESTPPHQPQVRPAPTYGAPAAPASHAGRPGRVQTIAVLCLVDGALNILWAISLAGGLLVSLVGILCTPVALYPLTLGILEIIYGTKLLANPPKVSQPARYLAIMQIANILVGDVISLVVGILSLVFYSDPEIEAYFDSIPASSS